MTLFAWDAERGGGGGRAALRTARPVCGTPAPCAPFSCREVAVTRRAVAQQFGVSEAVLRAGEREGRLPAWGTVPDGEYIKSVLLFVAWRESGRSTQSYPRTWDVGLGGGTGGAVDPFTATVRQIMREEGVDFGKAMVLAESRDKGAYEAYVRRNTVGDPAGRAARQTSTQPATRKGSVTERVLALANEKVRESREKAEADEAAQQRRGLPVRRAKRLSQGDAIVAVLSDAPGLYRDYLREQGHPHAAAFEPTTAPGSVHVDQDSQSWMTVPLWFNGTPVERMADRLQVLLPYWLRATGKLAVSIGDQATGIPSGAAFWHGFEELAAQAGLVAQPIPGRA